MRILTKVICENFLCIIAQLIFALPSSYPMRNTILTALYSSPELEALLAKMHPEHLREDLKQELFLVLASLPDAKLTDLHNSGGLRFWATRVVLNMTCSSSSPFYKMYRKSNVEFEETPTFKLPSYATNFDEVEEKEVKHTALLDAVNKSLDTQSWYDRELFTRYVEAGSAEKLRRKMKETTGNPIPRNSILNTVKKVRESIQQETPYQLLKEYQLC
jgi:hypothetical protein